MPGKAGGGKKKREEPQNADVRETYTSDAAAKTGKSRDTIKRSVKRGQIPATLLDIKGSPEWRS
jgi:hypothetical protein